MQEKRIGAKEYNVVDAGWPVVGGRGPLQCAGSFLGQTVVDGSRVFVKSFLSTHNTIHLQLVVSRPSQWNKSIQFTSLKHDAFVTNQTDIGIHP